MKRYSTRLWGSLLLAFACICSLPTTRANTTNAVIAAGGLMFTKNEAIVMQREDLTLTPGKVIIRYEMLNDTGAPVTLRVAFPMPEVPPITFVGNLLRDAPLKDPNFLNFQIFAVHAQSKEKISPELNVKALLPDGRDVAIELRRIGGWPLVLQPGIFDSDDRQSRIKAASDSVPEAGHHVMTAKVKKELFALNAIQEDKNIYMLPWRTTLTYHWMQTFAPGVTVLEQSYVPIKGVNFFSPSRSWTGKDWKDDKPARLEGISLTDFCIDRSTEERLLTFTKDGYGGAGNLKYILTTAQNWRGPIGNFHLTIEGDQATGAIALCTDLPLKKTGPMRYEAEVINYVPNKELEVLFVFSKP